jgi:ABC-type transport system involved in multi-copper enzyme maturation permease subunit
MKLIRYEIKKTLKSRIVLAGFLLLAAVMAVLSVTDREHFGISRANLKLSLEPYEFYSQIPEEELEAFIEEMTERYGSQVLEGFFPPETLVTPGYFGEQYSDYTILGIYDTFHMKNAEIKEKRSQAVKRSERMLEKGDLSAFETAKYRRIIEIYSKDVKAYNELSVGYREYLSLEYTLIPLILLALVFSFDRFTMEKKSNMDALLRTVKKGDYRIRTAKVLSSAVLTFVSGVLLELISFGMVVLNMGLHGGSAPVQILEDMILSPLRLSLLQYTFYVAFSRILCAVIFSVIFSLCSFLSANEWVSAAAGLLITALSLTVTYVFKIRGAFWQPLSIADTGYYMRSYDVVSLFGIPLYRHMAVFAVWLLISAILTMALFGFRKNRSGV